MSGVIKSSTLDATKVALDGLAMRQQMISRNIANVDTPGYQAQNINFEQAVKTALAKAEKPSLAITNAAHIQQQQNVSNVFSVNRAGGSDRADGNNVDIENELLQMNETTVRYQALTQMVSRKFTGIKAILASR